MARALEDWGGGALQFTGRPIQFLRERCLFVMRIDPHRLMRLAVLINQGSFRKAADKLGLTQPALSQSIAQLEDEIGVQLITRSARGVEPTIYGEALYGHAKAIDWELAQATQQIQNLVIGSSGFLLAGATTGGGIHIVAQAVCKLKETRPQSNMRISEEILIEPLLRQLHDRSIDLIFCQRLNNFDLSGVRAIRLFHTKKMLCVRRGHPLADSLDLQKFTDYPFLCPPDEMGILSDIKSIFSDNGLTLPEKNIIVSNSISFAKEVVLNSDGFSIFSDISVARERATGELICHELPMDQGSWYYLVTRPEYIATDLVRAFIREIFAICERWNVPVHNDAVRFERFGRGPSEGAVSVDLALT